MKNFHPTTEGCTSTTNRKPCIQHTWFHFLLSCLVVLLYSAQPAMAQKEPPNPGVGGTVFGGAGDQLEVDANFVSGIIPSFWGTSFSTSYTNLGVLGTDWSGPAGLLNKDGSGNAIPTTQANSADGKTLWQRDGNWGNQSTFAEISTFSGTSNKNNQLIGSDPYTVQTGGSGPQKNDITDLMLHVREVNGNTILFFGTGTRATSGSSYIDFEYNQAGLTQSGGYLTGNGPHGGRTINDFALIVNYEGGGAKPFVAFRKWVESPPGSYHWSDEQVVSGPNGYMTTNVAQITSVSPGYGVASNGASASVTGALQFVEGAVNLNSLIDITQLDQCNPNATMTVKTRSSASFTSELKDLSSALFPLTPAPAITQISPLQKCPGENASFSVNVSGPGANGANVQWYKDGSPISASSSDATSSTLNLTNLSPSDGGTYKAVLTGATCGSPETQALLTVYATPVGGPASQDVCPDVIGGATGTFNLSSLEAAVINGAANVSVEGWYEDPGYGTAIQTPGAYVSGSTTVYAKLIGEGGCIGQGSAALTLNGTPSGANQLIELCPTDIGGNTASFDLTTIEAAISAGNTFDGWFENYSGGVFSNQINPASNYVASNGTTVYARFLSADECAGVAEALLNVLQTPAVNNTAMEDCPDVAGGSDATFDLTSKNTEVANGSTVLGWYEGFNGNAFSNPIANPAAFVSSGQTVYAEIQGPNTCIGVAENVLTVNPSAAAPIVQYHAPACDEPNFIVEVTNPTDGATYKIVDKDGLNPDQIVYSAGDPNPEFSRPAGSGFSITATIGDCESLPAECTPSAQAAKPAEENARVAQAEIPVDGQVKIYPVPFSNRTTVEFYAKADGAYAVNLHDISGKLVRLLEEGTTKAGDFHRLEVEGNQLADGMYLVVVLNGKDKQAVRIIKEQ